MTRSSESDEIYAWLRKFKCAREDPDYTHTSMFGGRDWSTDTGKFKFPDTAEIQNMLFDSISKQYDRWQYLCLVEMCAKHRPFIEDLDILEKADAGGPPNFLILDTDFLKMRAQVLHRIFPSFGHLELTLFSASGWHTQKSQWKASFHAVWHQLIVTDERANLVRLATLDSFRSQSMKGPLAEIQQQLLEADVTNTWENVFDKTTVCGKSFRMPFCDKVVFGRKEGRPVMPLQVLRFDFNDSDNSVSQIVMHVADDLTNVEWLQRASVRRHATKDGQSLLPLTPWAEPLLRTTLPVAAPNAHGPSTTRLSSSSVTPLTQLVIDDWVAQQRSSRRLWSRPASELREQLDRAFPDPLGRPSTWVSMQAAPGKKRWLWKTGSLGGAIEVQEPDGEILVRGTQQQQARIIVKLKNITDPWIGLVRQPNSKQLHKLAQLSTSSHDISFSTADLSSISCDDVNEDVSSGEDDSMVTSSPDTAVAYDPEESSPVDPSLQILDTALEHSEKIEAAASLGDELENDIYVRQWHTVQRRRRCRSCIGILAEVGLDPKPRTPAQIRNARRSTSRLRRGRSCGARNAGSCAQLLDMSQSQGEKHDSTIGTKKEATQGDDEFLRPTVSRWRNRCSAQSKELQTEGSPPEPLESGKVVVSTLKDVSCNGRLREDDAQQLDNHKLPHKQVASSLISDSDAKQTMSWRTRWQQTPPCARSHIVARALAGDESDKNAKRDFLLLASTDITPGPLGARDTRNPEEAQGEEKSGIGRRRGRRPKKRQSRGAVVASVAAVSPPRNISLWICSHCAEPNKTKRLECNNCGKAKRFHEDIARQALQNEGSASVAAKREDIEAKVKAAQETQTKVFEAREEEKIKKKKKAEEGAANAAKRAEIEARVKSALEARAAEEARMKVEEKKQAAMVATVALPYFTMRDIHCMSGVSSAYMRLVFP